MNPDYYENWLNGKGRRSVFGDIPKSIIFSSSNDYRESEHCIGIDGYVMAQLQWRAYARVIVNSAIKRGELSPLNTQKCYLCQDKARDYHHHKGYHPKDLLNVLPICRRCHTKIHSSRRTKK